MNSEEGVDSRFPQPQRAQLSITTLGLRIAVLLIAVSGITVAATPARKSPIAIGILGPAFVVTCCWALIVAFCSVSGTLPAIRPSFTAVIDSIIAIGSVISLVFFGLYWHWWLEDSASGNNSENSSTKTLFQVALGLACTSTNNARSIMAINVSRSDKGIVNVRLLKWIIVGFVESAKINATMPTKGTMCSHISR
ncbi:hypothetical protein LIA77_11979 [Sarocladium implicatum]|nr:hypothetical protein LIA77_11979 [Sarocladium implicatum]